MFANQNLTIKTSLHPCHAFEIPDLPPNSWNDD